MYLATGDTSTVTALLAVGKRQMIGTAAIPLIPPEPAYSPVSPLYNASPTAGTHIAPAPPHPIYNPTSQHGSVAQDDGGSPGYNPTSPAYNPTSPAYNPTSQHGSVAQQAHALQSMDHAPTVLRDAEDASKAPPKKFTLAEYKQAAAGIEDHELERKFEGCFVESNVTFELMDEAQTKMFKSTKRCWLKVDLAWMNHTAADQFHLLLPSWVPAKRLAKVLRQRNSILGDVHSAACGFSLPDLKVGSEVAFMALRDTKLRVDWGDDASNEEAPFLLPFVSLSGSASDWLPAENEETNTEEAAAWANFQELLEEKSEVTVLDRPEKVGVGHHSILFYPTSILHIYLNDASAAVLLSAPSHFTLCYPTTSRWGRRRLWVNLMMEQIRCHFSERSSVASPKEPRQLSRSQCLAIASSLTDTHLARHSPLHFTRSFMTLCLKLALTLIITFLLASPVSLHRHLRQ